MAEPVQVTFRDIPRSDALVAHVEKRAAKLDTFFQRMTHCYVVLEVPHRRRHHGQRYHVRVDMHVPGRELVVSRNSEDEKEDLHVTVDGAFDDAERVLEDYARQLRSSEVKTRVGPPQGVVTKVFHDRGYGFLEGEEGHEIYFHEHSVLHGRFDRIAVGARVRYAEENGDKGPQASTVELVGSG